jgi:hypothetical protein
MTTIILLGGGGGYYAHGRYGAPGVGDAARYSRAAFEGSPSGFGNILSVIEFRMRLSDLEEAPHA